MLSAQKGNAMTIELVAISDDAPSGENLEYEKVFTDLELAAQPGEERQAGEEILEAEEPNYRDVAEKAREVLTQSHELRAAVYLANAEVRLNGMQGLAEVTTYIRGCLSEYWDTCHPELDEEDDEPAAMRVNSLLGIADATTVLRGVRNAPLSMSQAFGMVTLRMLDIQAGEITAREGENVLDSNAISAAFKDTNEETLQGIMDAVKTALDDVQAIDAVFDEKIPAQGPDLSPLIKALKKAEQVIGEEMGVEVEGGEEDGESDGSGGDAPKKSAAPGEISSQSDVAHSLQKIIQYYGRHEPSSPIPMLLERALRLVGADFMTIMKDIAPDGTDNAKVVGGIKEEEEY